MEQFVFATGESYRVYPSFDGPLIIRIPGKNPQLLYNVLFPGPGPGHCIPISRVFNPISRRRDDYEYVSPEDLYDERKKSGGRPLKFPLDTARDIFYAYWDGKASQKELAALHDTTVLTIHRLCTLRTYWMI